MLVQQNYNEEEDNDLEYSSHEDSIVTTHKIDTMAVINKEYI